MATLDRFSGNARRLEELEIDASDIEQALLEPVAKIADLEEPIVRASDDGGDSPGLHVPLAGWLFLAAAGLVIAFWVYWVVQGSDESFQPRQILAALRGVAAPLCPGL